MRITFTPSAWDDYVWFQENDRKLVKRINLHNKRLCSDALRRNWKARTTQGRVIRPLVPPRYSGTSPGLPSHLNRFDYYRMPVSLRSVRCGYRLLPSRRLKDYGS